MNERHEIEVQSMNLFRIDDAAFERLDWSQRYHRYHDLRKHIRKIPARWCAQRLIHAFSAFDATCSASEAIGLSVTALSRARKILVAPTPDVAPYVIFDFTRLDTITDPRAAIDIARGAGVLASRSLAFRRQELVADVMARSNESARQTSLLLRAGEESIRADWKLHIRRLTDGADDSSI